jgi:hypothetical protein
MPFPITGARYVCALAPGHASGPDRTACTDAENTLWWWCDTQGTPSTTPEGDLP